MKKEISLPPPRDDAAYVRRALALARRGRTSPNPMVGAIVVQTEGRIVGEGWHKGVGTPHAEAMAFAVAGEAARGATVYVTLEPCFHTVGVDGKPRISCASRCIAAGVARVVGAMEDPDSRVSGHGYAQLRDAGIAVTVGVEEARARAFLAPYRKQRTTGLPYVLHKAALTLDGKIAAPGGDARWVTGPAARRYVHRALRHRADAVIVGVGTVLADDPSLTTRLPRGNGHDPLRVVLDSRLRTPPTAQVARAGTLVLASRAAVGAEDTERRRVALEATGAEVVFLEADRRGRVDAAGAARYLAGKRGTLFALLESGGDVAASFFEAGLVDKVLYFVAPKIIGGRTANTPVDGDGLSRKMADAVRLGTLTVRRFDSDIALEAEVEK